MTGGLSGGFGEVTSFADAITARTASVIEAGLLADLTAAGVDVAGFGDFSMQRMLTVLQSRAQAALESLRVQLVYAGCATTAYMAGDDWVDVCLSGFFFEDRIQASKTQIGINVTAPAGSPLSANARQWVAQADDNTLFDNLDDVRIPAGGTKSVVFQARTAGIVGNSPPGLISHLVVGPPGVTVTNPAGSLVLAGRDQETSADYLIRCIGKWGTLGRGGNALAYYYYVPQASPTITRILIRDDNPFGPGTIGLCLANAAGPATQTEVDAVAALLQPIKPLGSGRLKVFGATPRTVAVGVQLVTDGTNGAAVANAIAVLNGLSATYPIASNSGNVSLFRDKLIQVLMDVRSVINLRNLTPPASVALQPYQVVQIAPTVTLA